MEQKVGSQQGVKVLLYFAVMSVFLRASLSGPSTIGPQNIHFETLVGPSEPSTFNLTSKDEEHPAIYHHQVALSSMDNAGVFSVVLASAAAFLNG
ncbi:15322_t:CDS:1, partial [Funneliformis caledonium]